jgi:hypothetical protein
MKEKRASDSPFPQAAAGSSIRKRKKAYRSPDAAAATDGLMSKLHVPIIR